MTMPQRGNSIELEPSQIKFLPSPDGSFPEAIYEFSVFVKIVEKVDGYVLSWKFPPEFPPRRVFPSLSISLFTLGFPTPLLNISK